MIETSTARLGSPAPPTSSELAGTPIVFFDGVCNLCDHAIQFVLDHERDLELSFISLQSPAARTLLVGACGEAQTEVLLRGAKSTGSPETIVVLEGRRVFLYSDGALRIARHLRAPWRWLSFFVVLPRGLRDAVYRLIARNRYRVFGKSESCRIPTDELRARFLDSAGA